MRPKPSVISDYPHRLIIPTRWSDNDVYGHVNNAVYYFYFDTVVNRFLIDKDLLEIGTSDVIGLVVETGCQYFAPISFPQEVSAGLAVSKIGTSSVRYEIGLFAGDNTTAAAQGHFVHVYVNEATRRPVPITDNMRTTLTEIYRD
ncbi:acyl-CoA thioesterase [Fretibacter rubidus]|uniref:acyl-CoA thioesterase n=1 Tax=Fretibacter rubidus TaxID=570162 RepID=UPI00352B2C73